jgi:hypothetical protein
VPPLIRGFLSEEMQSASGDHIVSGQWCRSGAPWWVFSPCYAAAIGSMMVSSLLSGAMVSSVIYLAR